MKSQKVLRTDLILALVSLFCLSLVVYLGKAYDTSLRGIDSNIHAAAAMNVTSNGFLPQLPMMLIDQPFNDHPFFDFWLNGWVMRLFGPSSWSARILTALFSSGCVLLTFTLGALLETPLFGFLSALLFLFCRDIILTGATFSLDMPMLFFILLSFVFWEKRRVVLMGLSVGIGLWFKSPVVLAVFPVALIQVLLQKDNKRNLFPLAYSAILALLVGSIVWIITWQIAGWNWVSDYWMRQVFGTAVQGRNYIQKPDWGMFFTTVKSGFLPGLPFLLAALVLVTLKRKWKQTSFQSIYLPIVVIGVCVTALRFKYPYYYNPTFPFLALLSAHSIYSYSKKHESKIYSGFTALSSILMAVLLASPISFGPEAFVALKRFEPIIQSYGNCSDTVLYLPGGEPVGSAHDYLLHLQFYTGRKIKIVSCDELKNVLDQSPITKYPWLITSIENRNSCLSGDLKYASYFNRIFQVGSQLLLTQLSSKDPVDLTPLEREYSAVTDCKARPLPQDIYHRY